MRGLTLGGLIEILEALPDGLVLANVSDRLTSYRGYYDHLAIKPGNTTTGALLEALRQAVGATYQGYKGGDYVMGDSTPLWLSEYGYASEQRVIGIGLSAPMIGFVATEEHDGY